MAKRNLTVQLDDEVIHQAKVLAARRGTSVSTLVAAELKRLVADDGRYEEARQRAQRALTGARPRGGRRWERDELHAAPCRIGDGMELLDHEENAPQYPRERRCDHDGDDDALADLHLSRRNHHLPLRREPDP